MPPDDADQYDTCDTAWFAVSPVNAMDDHVIDLALGRLDAALRTVRSARLAA